MSSSRNNDSFPRNRDPEAAARRRSETGGLSTSEMVNRAFREPYFHFLLFLTALWRQGFWVLPAGLLLGVCFGGLHFLLSPEQYTSETWIRVYNEPRYIAFPRQHSSEETRAIVQANLQFIYSPPVLDNAWSAIMEKSQAEGIDISKLLELREPTDWLAKNISVQRRGESPIYIFSFTTENARLSQLILESIMTSYFAFMSESNKRKEDYQLVSLRESASVKRKEIEDLHTRYLRIANQITEAGGELPSELNRVIVSQTPLAMQIIELEARIKAQEILLQSNRKALTDDFEIEDAVIAVDVYANPVMEQLIGERVALLDQLEKMALKNESNEAWGMTSIQRKLDNLETRIQRAQEQLAIEAKQRRKAERRETAHQRILEGEQLIEQLKSQVNSLREANRQQQSEQGGMSKLVSEAMEVLNMKNREEQVYDILLSQIGVLTTESAAPEQVDMIANAKFPAYANSGARNRMTVLLCLFGFLIPVMLAWGREVLLPRFYHTSQFPILFPDVALETIAEVPLPGREHHMNDRQKRAYYFSIDEACNDFCFGQSFQGVRVFLFSSVCNDDGQSQLALSVAERIAQMKKKPVLLVDTQGDDPILRRLFGTEGKGSLGDVLSLRLSLNEAIVSDPQQQNLYFLPDGTSPGHSSIDQFSDGRFEMLLGELKKHYPTIIISTAPMEKSPAAQMLCHYSDAIVLSLRIFETYRRNTETMCERLANVGTPANAFLVSGVPSKKKR